MIIPNLTGFRDYAFGGILRPNNYKNHIQPANQATTICYFSFKVICLLTPHVQ